MKTKTIQVLILLLIFGFAAKAQGTITISGTKFTYPLIEKWITEYTKNNPQAKIKLVNKKNEAKQPDISIIARQPQKTDLSENQQIVFVNKYALLPVTGKSNAFLKDIIKRGLNKKELEKLFFEEGLLEESKQEKTKYPVTIYARESQACSSVAFANYFGYQPTEIRGKKIFGDDIYLIASIKKDSTGITFNNLGYIYDIQTRKTKDGISLLPLEINKEAFAAINNTVDDALNVLENATFETIPVEKVGFVFNNNTENREILKFLKWVITDGQKYNHEFAFLNLDKELQVKQSEKLSEKLLTSK